MTDHFADTPYGRIHWTEDGGGDPLLLLHSNGCSLHEYDDVVAELARNWRVFAWDMPGHGDSDRPGRHQGVGDYADAVVAWMDVLGLDRAWVAGASIGGLVGLDLGARHAHRVKGVLIVEAVLQPEEAWHTQWPLVESVFGVAVQTFEEVQPRFRRLTPALLRRWNIDRSKAGAWAMTDVMWAIRQYDAAGACSRIRCPAAVVLGAKGPAIASAGRWRDQLPSAAHYAMEDCGHFPMWDDPEGFVRVVNEAIAALSGDAA